MSPVDNVGCCFELALRVHVMMYIELIIIGKLVITPCSKVQPLNLNIDTVGQLFNLTSSVDGDLIPYTHPSLLCSIYYSNIIIVVW